MAEDKEYKALLKRVAKNIRKMREARDLTQEDMTEYGFNYRYYQKVESGEQGLTLQMLHRLAKVLKCDLERFLEK